MQLYSKEKNVSQPIEVCAVHAREGGGWATEGGRPDARAPTRRTTGALLPTLSAGRLNVS